jgi:hypothetical protein
VTRHTYIGVDFDGTLATHPHPPNFELGSPVTVMVERVKRWLKQGIEVRIITARAAVFESEDYCDSDVEKAISDIQYWCYCNISPQKFTVQAHKDFGMVALWDDLAVSVCQDTGWKSGWDQRNTDPLTKEEEYELVTGRTAPKGLK